MASGIDIDIKLFNLENKVAYLVYKAKVLCKFKDWDS